MNKINFSLLIYAQNESLFFAWFIYGLVKFDYQNSKKFFFYVTKKIFLGEFLKSKNVFFLENIIFAIQSKNFVKIYFVSFMYF